MTFREFLFYVEQGTVGTGGPESSGALGMNVFKVNMQKNLVAPHSINRLKTKPTGTPQVKGPLQSGKFGAVNKSIKSLVKNK